MNALSRLSQRAGPSIRAALRSRGAAAFVIAALAVGLLVGLAAALLVWVIGLVDAGTQVLRDDVGWERLAFVVTVPLGTLVAWLIAQRWLADVSTGGVTTTMVGLSLHAGYLPTRSIGAKIAATAVTLGSGGSGGREGPVVQIGGTIGSSFARYTRFGEDQIRSLVAAGAGAGIGASFNAPIAGMLFAMEVILGNFAIRHLNAVVIASVTAAVTTRTLVGEERILSAPVHGLLDARELLLYAAIGIIAVALGILFLRLLDATAGETITARFPPWVRPVAFGLIVAVIGLVEPRVLGTGQEFVGEVLRIDDVSGQTWYVLLALGLAKMVTNSLTRAGGGSGGTFMPSLFIGSSAGAGFAILMQPIWGFSELNPGAFAVVGMAATFAAVARAPLTAIIIVFEITGDYGLVLPLMLAASLATFLADRYHPESAYTLPLSRLGINLPANEDIDLLDTVTVGEVMSKTLEVLSPSLSLSEAHRVFEESGHHGMAVSDDGRLAGLVTRADLARAGPPRDDVTVASIMTAKPITVTESMPVSAALARMAALDIGRMPVVSDQDPTRLIGMFRRESVVHAYHQALGSQTERHLYRQRLRQRAEVGTQFFEVPVPAASPVHGTTVRELEWPEGAVLVSIRRGPAVVIPHGDTTLLTGDVITAFGTSESRVELAYMVEPQGG